MKKLYLALLLCLLAFSASFAQNEFITEWNTTSTTLVFPGIGSGYTISWEQVGNPANSGTIANANSGQNMFLSPAGKYIIKASAGNGTFTGFDVSTHSTDRDELAFVRQWGNTVWQKLTFALCINVDVTATDVPLFSSASDINYLFNGCEKLVGNSTFNSWNTSAITSMGHVFAGAHLFNQPLNNWVTSNVTNMSGMFLEAKSFNQPIGNWDVSNVQYMSAMFSRAYVFNQPIGGWNTGNVLNMSFMFQDNPVFNQPLNTWNTSKVVVMTYLFNRATAYNQPLNNWDTKNVTDMTYTFRDASSFNQSLATWSLQSIESFVDVANSGIDCQNYSATLTAWAAATDTPDDLFLDAADMEYNSAAQAARAALTAKGWNIADDAYNAACSGALPVSFGTLQAYIRNGSLNISWETLIENNNDHFIIEISKDGKTFFPVANLQSKALHGNSDQRLRYHYEISEKTARDIAAGSLVLSFLLLGLGTPKMRSRVVALLLLLFVVTSTQYSCSKNDQAVEASDNGPLFVRIKQVDKDGGNQATRIINVVKE